MIDTIKIYTFINKDIYEDIKFKSDIKCSYNLNNNTIYYEIVNGHLQGTFDSRLSVRVGDSSRYGFNGYYIEAECSYHKLVRGHNCFDGFYNIQEICLGIINLIENGFSIKLPGLSHWFLSRIDITKVYNLGTNKNVQKYINYFRTLSFPRRNLKFYEGESIYCSGSTTTLKIYNKLKEFKKNDLKKIKKFNIDYIKFLNKIDGYIRFECEIKSRKLKSIFKKRFIRVNSLNYYLFNDVWCDEFMKILKFKSNEINLVKNKDVVFDRLHKFYKLNTANNLYNFFLNIKVNGYDFVKNSSSKSSFYRKINQLKEAGIDFSGTFEIFEEDIQVIDFNPFVDFEREVS